MTTKIRPLGSSSAVIIPKKVMKEIGLEQDGAVNMEIEDGKLIITKKNKFHIDDFWGILNNEEGKRLDAHINNIRSEWNTL